MQAIEMIYLDVKWSKLKQVGSEKKNFFSYCDVYLDLMANKVTVFSRNATRGRK